MQTNQSRKLYFKHCMIYFLNFKNLEIDPSPNNKSKNENKLNKLNKAYCDEIKKFHFMILLENTHGIRGENRVIS